MDQPDNILACGTKVRTRAVLKNSTRAAKTHDLGASLGSRIPDTEGVISGLVSGSLYGADMYLVRHAGSGADSIYHYSELELIVAPQIVGSALEALLSAYLTMVDGTGKVRVIVESAFLGNHGDYGYSVSVRIGKIVVVQAQSKTVEAAAFAAIEVLRHQGAKM